MSFPVNCEKDWIDILSALLTPTIAILGIGIAAFQLKINRDRYKHELFDRRWAQFIAIRNFIGHVFSHGKMKHEEEYSLLTNTQGAIFLFDQEIKDYISELTKNAWKLNTLNEELTSILEQNARKENIEKQREIKNWFAKQLSEIETIFGKYMKLSSGWKMAGCFPKGKT